MSTPPLINATPVEVTFRDGTKATITLSELSIRQLYVFIKHLGGSDTPALVALCAGKPAEWVDTLSDASFDALVAVSIKLNFQRATDRVKNDPVALGKLAPMLFELESAIGHLETRISGQPGRTALPAPVPSASAPETGSAAST